MISLPVPHINEGVIIMHAPTRATISVLRLIPKNKNKCNGSDDNDCCAYVDIYFHFPSKSFAYTQSDMIIILLLLYNTAAEVRCRKLSFWRMPCNESRGTCGVTCLHITHIHSLFLVCTLNMYNMRHSCCITTTIM
jgi:hypothetical protein